MKNYLITAGISFAVVLAVVTLMPQKVINQIQTLGAVSSPDIMSPYFSFGGVRFWGAHTESLKAATTTVCALQSPAATSTLVSGSLNLVTASTTASVVTVAKAATAYATTTLINRVSYGAGATGVALFASTTLSALEQTNRIFAPSTYLVVGMSGGTGTFSPVGSCQAVWMQDLY